MSHFKVCPHGIAVRGGCPACMRERNQKIRRLTVELAGQSTLLEEARKIIVTVEWIDGDGATSCCICGNRKAFGHQRNCRIKQFLSLASSSPAPDEVKPNA
jgi:hypothetical protein